MRTMNQRLAGALAIALLGVVLGLASAASGQETCFGSAPTITGSGTIVGTDGDDVIIGSSGNDVIQGRGGNDKICGEAGDDQLGGGPGNDQVDGGRAAIHSPVDPGTTRSSAV